MVVMSSRSVLLSAVEGRGREGIVSGRFPHFLTRFPSGTLLHFVFQGSHIKPSNTRGTLIITGPLRSLALGMRDERIGARGATDAGCKS